MLSFTPVRCCPAEECCEKDIGNSAADGEVECEENAVDDEACSPEDEIAHG